MLYDRAVPRRVQKPLSSAEKVTHLGCMSARCLRQERRCCTSVMLVMKTCSIAYQCGFGMLTRRRKGFSSGLISETHHDQWPSPSKPSTFTPEIPDIFSLFNSYRDTSNKILYKRYHDEAVYVQSLATGIGCHGRCCTNAKYVAVSQYQVPLAESKDINGLMTIQEEFIPTKVDTRGPTLTSPSRDADSPFGKRATEGSDKHDSEYIGLSADGAFGKRASNEANDETSSRFITPSGDKRFGKRYVDPAKNAESQASADSQFGKRADEISEAHTFDHTGPSADVQFGM